MRGFRNKKIFNILITAGFLCLFLVYLTLNFDDFKILRSIKIYYIFLIAFLQASVILVNAIFFIVIFGAYDLRIDFKEGLNTSIITAVGNYFTPFRGGLGIRAVYMKKKFNFPYSKFAATVAGNYVIVFFINSLIALVSLLLLKLDGKNFDITLFLIFLAIFSALFFIIIFPIPEKKIPGEDVRFIGGFIKKIKLVLGGWNVMAGKKMLIFQLSFLTILNALIGILLYFLELKSIGIETNLLYASVFSSISAISLLLSLTPGSLGIRESLLVLFQTSLMLGTSEILASSVVDRVVYFFVMIVLSIFIRVFNKIK